MMDAPLKYVFAETLPSGAVRYRFRRDGKKVTLKGAPGAPEFHAHYAALLAGLPKVAEEMRPVQGSVSWLVSEYMSHLELQVALNLASPLTLKGHRHHLSRLVAEYGKKDANIPRSAVIFLRDKYAATPGAADNLRKAISALYKWAIDRDKVSISNPTRDVSRLNRKSSGFTPWTAEDFKKYLAHHRSGTMARRALIIAISTTARRGDVVRLGRQHEFLRDGRKWLRWKQAKAPNAVVELPMAQILVREVEGHDNLTYIVNGYGAAFSGAGLGNKFREWCVDAGLDGKSLHGVRKGLANLLPSAGASSLELDVLLGHEMNSPETKVYVADAQRAGLAAAVMDRIDALKW